ncbi:MAG: penicillin-insensitive murein endopeptidase [Myxococcota bacterium]
MVRMLTSLMIATICGCVPKPVPTGEAISVGSPDDGYLVGGVRLEDEGLGYRRLRPGESTRFGTATLVHAIERAAKSVAETFPGGYPLRVGDLSNPYGGAHPRHRSHRAGRDADLIFYARDLGGLPARAAAWMAFDRFGFGTHDQHVLEFDEARNWHLVRTLVLDDDARVKWMFCSNDVKARLLRYAARHEPSAKAVARATWVLHQPSRGQSHADHFHVRVGCGPVERDFGCVEEAPHWPWLSDTASKRNAAAGVGGRDAQLVDWLLGEQHLDQDGDVFRRRFGLASQPAAVTGGRFD